ncbi:MULTISPECIES: ParA family protein [Neptunomonas]|uniref:ParA family protein n=1 Tax=Neptunomonas marina TaxID=1815562 RepID=A0A437Q896_9GAMM|nr:MULTISPECIES: ParA family protein [Neptunomonas]RVU30765.1 ParA family protein [Neptunomonas marina]
MKRVVYNQKGGVGKSSIAVNLAAISAAQGKKTVVVDLDPQGNATDYLLGKEVREGKDIKDFFEQVLTFQLKPQAPQEFIHATDHDNLFVIPSNSSLGDLQSKLESKHKIYKLRDALNQLSEFDAIYIDTPPAFNFFSLSALVAAERCLVPFDCDDFARAGLYALMENVREVCLDHNEALTIEGIVVNQYQARASLPQQVVAELKAEGLPILEQKLSASVKMKESHAACLPLIFQAPSHKLTLEFISLFDSLH